MNFEEAYKIAKYEGKKLIRPHSVYSATMIMMSFENNNCIVQYYHHPNCARCNYELTGRDLNANDWEIVKEKVKRYQVLYTDKIGKNFYLTSKDEKWTKEEFIRNFDIACCRRVFHSIILESEKEFDE